MVKKSARPPGIKEIAKALGVSIGTVDRALHNRADVNPATREKVLKMAKALNYTPNFAARNLKLARRYRIGVFLPRHIAGFFDSVREGIRQSAANLSVGASLDIEFHEYPRIGEGDIACLKKARWRRYDGIIFAPGDPTSLMKFIKEDGPAPPMVLVASDAPRSGRLACMAVDAGVSGNIAADLLGLGIPKQGIVACITGDLRIMDHADKLRGFAGALATLTPHLSLLPPIESHESPKDAYAAAVKLFRDHPRLDGLYVNTANSLPVLQAAEEAGRLGHLRIVTTDLFPALAQLIESGKVLATLYQRPRTQGRMAVELLYRQFAGAPPQDMPGRLAPHIVLRSNLCLFLDSVEKKETQDSPD